MQLGSVLWDTDASASLTPALSPAADAPGALRSLSLSVQVVVPPNAMRVVPPPSEVLKFAWMQWVVVYVYVQFGLSFVFRENVLAASEGVDGPRERKAHSD